MFIVRQYKIIVNDYDKPEKIQSFIDSHWSPSHILAKNRGLFDWQYFDKTLSNYNFSIALDSFSNDIVGLLGFIPTYHFDPTLRAETDLWGAVWKVLHGTDSLTYKNGKIAGLGTSLLDHLITTKKVRSYGAIGINKKVARLYRYLGFSVGHLKHYYIVNQKKSHFSILDRFNGVFCTTQTPEETHYVSLINTQDEFNINSSPETIPVKSSLYFINRYIRHPFYDYTLLRITNSRTESCVIVYRLVKISDSRAVRIVDFAGNPFAITGATAVFQDILQEHDAEYIDFYNYGIPEDVLKNAGFLLRGSDTSIVVPNYFEPFERRNIDIMFAYKIFSEKPYTYTVCKGDADQDRPNLL